MHILDVSLVRSQPFDRDETLALVQRAGRHRGIREDPDAEENGEDAKEDEHPLVRIETASVELSNGIKDEARRDADEAVGRVPDGDARRLFFAFPP